MRGVQDELGEDVVPEIYSSLNAEGLADLMEISRATTTSDGAGGQIKTGADASNPDPIPCRYKPRNYTGFKGQNRDALISHTLYDIQFPTTQYGEALEISPRDRIKVLERGQRPERTFRVMSLQDKAGVLYTAVCELEDE